MQPNPFVVIDPTEINQAYNSHLLRLEIQIFCKLKRTITSLLVSMTQLLMRHFFSIFALLNIRKII